jgi:hypothetical protein
VQVELFGAALASPELIATLRGRRGGGAARLRRGNDAASIYFAGGLFINPGDDASLLGAIKAPRTVAAGRVLTGGSAGDGGPMSQPSLPSSIETLMIT